MQEHPNDRQVCCYTTAHLQQDGFVNAAQVGSFLQVVMAAAAAAGLNRNGIRRTAFSTGDLQALSVLPTKNSPSPPDPANANLHRYKSSCLFVAEPINYCAHPAPLLCIVKCWWAGLCGCYC